MKNPPQSFMTQGLETDCGGLYWTRTSDPIDVNDVLSKIGCSHSTFSHCADEGLP